MARLFISHSSKDNVYAVAFQRWLEANGWSKDDVFIDFHGIGAGERWRDTLRKANAACEAVILLASPGSLDSVECQKELELAEALQKEIVFAILRDVTKRDPRLARYSDRQFVDLSLFPQDHIEAFEYDGRSHRIGFNPGELAKIKGRLDDLGIAPGSFAWMPRKPDDGPYPGLEAFTEDDAGIYFGRDADIMSGLTELRLMRRRRSPRLLVIQAPSGAGKSSFLRAGLWPRLKRDPDFAPLAIVRPAGGIVTGPDGLGRRLAPWFAQRKAPGEIHAAVGVAASGSAGPALASLLAEASGLAAQQRRVGAPDARPPAILIGIDQGEELFAAENATESMHFLALLAAVLREPPPDVDPYVVLTIRADSVETLLRRVPSLGLETPKPMFLPALSETAYGDVIARPAEVYSDRVRRLEIDPRLTAALIEDAKGADALPLLAFTLQQLFADFAASGKLGVEGYRAMGGIGGSIDRKLADARKAAGALGTEGSLRRLVVPGLATWDPAAGAAKRLVASEERLLGGERAALRPLADALAEARLLTRGAGTLEVAHEALLRRKPISDWLEARKDALRLRDVVLHEAREWEGGKAERDLVRRGERLEQARALAADPEFTTEMEPAAPYLTACAAHERAEIDKQRRIIGRAFVKPALAALEEGLSEHALRLAAAGTILADDLGLELVPELWSPLARAAFASPTRAVLKGHTGAVNVSAFSPDGRRIVTASSDNTARVWDAESGKEIALLKAHERSVNSASFSYDGQRVVTASSDNTARVWDAESGKVIALLNAHERSVNGASFSPDGKCVVTASSDNMARVWDAESGKEIAFLKGHTDTVWNASFGPDGRRILTASSDQTARIWDAESGKEIALLNAHKAAVTSASFSPDGRWIVTASSDNTARVWDAESGKEIALLKAHSGLGLAASFSPDGRRIVTASSDSTARVWDAESGNEIALLKAHERSVNSASFSSDGRRIVTASSDNTARVWDAESGKEIALLKAHERNVNSASFSPDGRRIVTASSDNLARVWDAGAGKEVVLFRGHGGVVRSASFSPDDRRLVTASDDYTARVWDAESGKEIVQLKGHIGTVWSASFSPDGKRIVTASGDNTARVWDVESGREL